MKYTEESFEKFCNAAREDLLSDFPEAEGDASYFFDLADGLLLTDGELTNYMIKRFKINKRSRLREILADHICS